MPKKKNNGDELQPYDPKNGEYLSDQIEKDELEMAADFMSRRASFHPFPTESHSRVYCQRYIECHAAWEEASCDSRKFTEYLLDDLKCHSKAKFFSQFLGFDKTNWKELYDQILAEVKTARPVFREVNKFGVAAFTIITVMSAMGKPGAMRKPYRILVGWLIGFDGIPRLTTVRPYKPTKGDKHEI